MSGINSSSLPNRQKWRNELLTKNNITNHANAKDPIAAIRKQLLANTICCSRNDCDKLKVETLQERVWRNRDSILFPPLSSTYPVGRDIPPGKKDSKGSTTPEPYNPPFCPCVINRAHLVTYCCVRRDCDDASKVVPERPIAYSHFKF